MHLAGFAHVVASPDETRRPVAACERAVVLHRGGRAPDVRVRLLRFGAAEEAVGDLCGPVSVRHEPETRRARVPLVRVEVVAVLVRLASVEERAFELEPAVSKT